MDFLIDIIVNDTSSPENLFPRGREVRTAYRKDKGGKKRDESGRQIYH